MKKIIVLFSILIFTGAAFAGPPSFPPAGPLFAENVVVGSEAAGKNLTVNATLGPEMAPALVAGNWTLGTDGTGGWAIVGGALVKTASAGTQTATPSGTFAVVAGRTYKVVITASAASTPTTGVSIGGANGRNMGAAAVFTSYVTAVTTDKLIMTASSTRTITITSISVKEFTPSTGDVKINGGRLFATDIYDNLGIRAISIGPEGTVGIGGVASQAGYALHLTGSMRTTANYYGLALTNGELSWLYMNEANYTGAFRNAANQSILRVYNTYTDASNYERLTLTGVAGSSVNVTAETAGTGGDNLDVVLTPAGTGGVLTSHKEIIATASATLNASQVRGTVINNYGQTAAVTLELPAAVRGMSFSAVLGTTVAQTFRLDPNINDLIILDGVAGADGKYVGLAAAVQGAAISCLTIQTGASAWDWACYTGQGSWAAE